MCIRVFWTFSPTCQQLQSKLHLNANTVSLQTKLNVYELTASDSREKGRCV